jgi:uncharacterized protein (DUF1800 family)
MVMEKQQLFPITTLALAAGCAVHNAHSARLEPTPAMHALPPATPDAVQHVLARFTFGATPGAAEEVTRLGIAAWFEAELAAQRDAKTSPYGHALGEPEDVIAAFSASRDSDPVDTEQISLRKQARRVNVKELIATVGAAQVARQVESEAQLHALMVDFWTNHFNVFLRKSALKILAGNYVETAIVPHALGRFEDLLIATARHPAMLVYLDNDKSVAARPRARRGLNENYARELLELHTLGVDAGYSQADVIDVARVLTGWGLGDPRDQRLDFEFSSERHDTGAKTVLGQHFPGGGGEAGETEALTLLRFLARHPATARHVSRKLCQRFISDEPPAACVVSVARTFLATQGDVSAVLRAILSQPGFWDRSVRGAKLKKPSEFLASALRALDLSLDGTSEIAKVTEQLGEPPLLYPAPTGYPDTASAWAGGSQILARMDVAARLVSGKIPGLNLDALNELVPVTADTGSLMESIDARLFGGLGDAQTLDIVREEASHASSPEEARNTALALALGSPAFQRR